MCSVKNPKEAGKCLACVTPKDDDAVGNVGSENGAGSKSVVKASAGVIGAGGFSFEGAPSSSTGITTGSKPFMGSWAGATPAKSKRDRDVRNDKEKASRRVPPAPAAIRRQLDSHTATREASLVPYKAKMLVPRSTSDGRQLTPCICNISMEESMRIEILLASEEWNRMTMSDMQGYDDPEIVHPRKSRTIASKGDGEIMASNAATHEASLVPYKAKTLSQRIKAIDLIERVSQTN